MDSKYILIVDDEQRMRSLIKDFLNYFYILSKI